MQTVAAFEAKTHLSALLEKVQDGEQIIITKHGHPIAKLVPIDKTSTDDVQKTVDTIIAIRRKRKLKLNEDWKALRDEGRR